MRSLATAVVLALATSMVGTSACSSDPDSIHPGRPATGRDADANPGSKDGGTPEGSSASGSGPGPTAEAEGGGPSTGASKPNCKYQAHKTGLTQLQQADGLSFNVYAPMTYDANVGHTVVVIMHGQDSNGVPELNAFWKSIADNPQDHLVLVAPKGSRAATNGDANAGNWATADLDKVLAIMMLVDDCYDVFPNKHILWGFSEGTFYGYLLGIGAADRFSGLAMGGANTSFARQNGYPPSAATWKIPVSDVHGTADPNPISLTYQDRTDFQALGHVFTLHEHTGGHTISAAQVVSQYDDVKASSSP